MWCCDFLTCYFLVNVSPLVKCYCVLFQGRLPHREKAEHAQGHPLHSQPVPQGQNLAAKDQAQQEGIPDLSRRRRLLQYDWQPLQTGTGCCASPSHWLVAIEKLCRVIPRLVCCLTLPSSVLQLAFESLSVIVNALTLLEAGQVAVCRWVTESNSNAWTFFNIQYTLLFYSLCEGGR